MYRSRFPDPDWGFFFLAIDVYLTYILEGYIVNS